MFRSSRVVSRIALLGVLVALGGLAARRLRAAEERRTIMQALADEAARERRARADQIRVWRVALAADSQSAIALGQLAGLYVQRARETGDERNYVLAEDMARRSLALRTRRNEKTYVTLATTLLARHRFSEAREVAAAAVKAEPDVPQYRSLLAEIQMELGDYSSAARGFDGLWGYRAHLSIAPRLARWLENTGRPRHAQMILERLVAEAQRRRDLPREQVAWFHFRLGDHYRRYGSPRRAEREFREALAVNPGDYRALRGLADLAMARGAAREAAEFARLASQRSKTPETLIPLADALRANGSERVADSVHRDVARLLAAKPAPFERAWYLHELEWGRDVAEITRVLEREIAERRDVHGYDLLAWAYYKSGRFAEARAAIIQALRSNTSDALVWYHAGMIEAAAGDSASARRALSRALALNPAFHYQHAAEARRLVE